MFILKNNLESCIQEETLHITVCSECSDDCIRWCQGTARNGENHSTFLLARRFVGWPLLTSCATKRFKIEPATWRTSSRGLSNETLLFAAVWCVTRLSGGIRIERVGRRRIFKGRKEGQCFDLLQKPHASRGWGLIWESEQSDSLCGVQPWLGDNDCYLNDVICGLWCTSMPYHMATLNFAVIQATVWKVTLPYSWPRLVLVFDLWSVAAQGNASNLDSLRQGFCILQGDRQASVVSSVS